MAPARSQPNNTEQGEWVPRPDPSTLTTAQLLQHISMLKELLESRLNSVERRLDLYPGAIDKQVEQLKEHEEETFKLHVEKFHGVQRQFEERDTRTDKTAELNQKAIDAALQAAKELVGVQAKSNELTNAKTEAMLIKQVDGIIDLIKANALSASDKTEANAQSAGGKIDDLKERLAAMENRIAGYESRGMGTPESGRVRAVTDRVTEMEGRGKGMADGWGVIIGVIGIVAAVAMVFATILHK